MNRLLDLARDGVEKSVPKRISWHLLFFTALGATLLQGPWLWAARASWIVLALLFMVDFRFALYAAFFFSGFFHPAGFLKVLPFTLKHFHVALFLSLLVRLIRGGVWSDLRSTLSGARAFLPIFLILAIGVADSFMLDYPGKSLRILANLFLVLVLTCFFMAFLKEELSRSGDFFPLTLGLTYYLGSVCLQIILGVVNTAAGTSFLDLTLIHNNHLGILCALSVFYAMALEAAEKDNALRSVQFGMMVLIFCGLVASCSRTAWFSFLGAFLPFSVLTRAKVKVFNLPKIFRVRRKFILILLVGIVALLCAANNDIFCRVRNLPQLLDPGYWQYTLHDKQNFGCLGIYRLRDLRVLKHILAEHPVLGVGFPHYITDFHGLLFMLLGATGVVGLALFLFFMQRRLSGLWSVMWLPQRRGVFFLEIGCFASLLAWMFCSLMETCFLQFFLWIHVAIACVLAECVRAGKTDVPPEPPGPSPRLRGAALEYLIAEKGQDS